MIPEFILDNVFEKLDEDVYYCSAKYGDGWIIYWSQDDSVFHTYRYPPDWYKKE